MLKNKIIGRKIRNIVILLMAIIIMLGAYKYIDKSKAENVIEINALVVDNSGYLEEEEIKLEAKQLEDDSYEIQLPEISNDKKINQITKISLENIVGASTTGDSKGETESIVDANTTGDSKGEKTEGIVSASTAGDSNEENPEDILEIIENRIYLTKEQIESKQIKLEVEYDVKEIENNVAEVENNEEEVEKTRLYNKILKYEDEENGKLVEVKGYLPVDAELQVEKVSQEQLTEIFGDKKIKVAYDIKILQQVITEVPADEAAPDAEPTQIIETIEINPEEFGEKCEVTITDANIAEKSKVYHVKEDNSYEQVNVTGGEEGNVSFEAQSFSVYAVEDDEIIPDEGEETGVEQPWVSYITLQLPGEGHSSYYTDNAGNWLYLTVPYGTTFIKLGYNANLYHPNTLQPNGKYIGTCQWCSERKWSTIFWSSIRCWNMEIYV